MGIDIDDIYFPIPILLPWAKERLTQLRLKAPKENQSILMDCDIGFLMTPNGPDAITILHKDSGLTVVIPRAMFYTVGRQSSLIQGSQLKGLQM